MPSLASAFPRTDRRVTEWMAKHGTDATRIALGLVFLWFGFLKFFPGVSAEESLATRTMSVLSFGVIPPGVSRTLLAAWECAIGVGLLTNKALRFTLLLLFVQMLGTLLPLVVFPHETFARIPFVPSLQGQFIIKNVVLIGAAILVGGTVRGGRMIADPHAAHVAERIEERAPS